MSLTRPQILICVDVTSLSSEVMVIYCHGSVLLRTWHYDNKRLQIKRKTRISRRSHKWKRGYGRTRK